MRQSFNIQVLICPVLVRCGGVALLTKPWLCGGICRGFGKCAAGVGHAFGLDVPRIAQFIYVNVEFTSNMAFLGGYVAGFSSSFSGQRC